MPGHDHHFLSRLDRVSDEHVELALALYRDDILLKLVMSTCEIGDQVPRVAIALGPRDRGPFLVVARDGGFVTCLGEGMSPGPWPVISRGKLDAIAKNIKHLHDKIAFAKRAGRSGSTSVGAQLRDRIMEAGMQLCREDYQAAAALHPLLSLYYCAWMADANMAAGKLRERLHGIRRSTPAYEGALRKFYELACAAGHLCLLTLHDPQAFWDRAPSDLRDELPKVAWMGIRNGSMGSALRGLYSAGRLGKLVLAAIEKLHQTAGSDLGFWAFSGGLAAIGMRNPQLRAEVLGALTTPAYGRGGEALVRRMERLAGALLPRFRACLEDMDREVEMAQQLARATALQVLEDGGHTEYETAGDVPVELARHLMCSSADSFIGSVDTQIVLSGYMPWAMTLEPEEFYAPRAQMKVLGLSWRPQVSLDLLAGLRDYSPRPSRTLGERTPGPNEPCSCGSTRKFKKCCGRPGAPRAHDPGDGDA
jgi:hypothetical protein